MRIHTEWATAGREVAEVDTEGDTDAVAVGDRRDRALDITTGILRVVELGGGERSRVDNSRRVILDDCSVAKDSRNWNIRGLGADKTKESDHQDRENGSGMHIGGSVIKVDSKGEASCIPLVPGSLGNEMYEVAQICSPAGDRRFYEESNLGKPDD